MRATKLLTHPRALCILLCLLAMMWNGHQRATADIDSRMTPLVRAVADARPSVVNIRGRKTVRDQVSSYSSSADKQVNGMGTGVVIDPRGYIITNYHVIEGVSQIQVSLHDHSTSIARLVAHDPETDLAIIKIPTSEPLQVIEIGNSDTLMLAETVVAVGNAFGYEHTVTRGIVSELNRTVQVSEDQIYYDLIQTDASINPGNSGGPLLNIDGEMIGINVAVRVGAQGIGFAIPVNDAMDVAARLLGEVVSKNTYHGINARTHFIDASKSEVVVEAVAISSAAADAGIRSGDIIDSINGEKISRALDIERALLESSIRDDLEIEIRRDGETRVASMQVKSSARQSSSDATVCWERLGVRLREISDQEFRRITDRYRGGMRVSSVRPNSPAARQGIRANDVLVGMHIWETLSYENVAYILQQPEVDSDKTFKFYIVRGSETLWGDIRIASNR